MIDQSFRLKFNVDQKRVFTVKSLVFPKLAWWQWLLIILGIAGAGASAVYMVKKKKYGKH